MRQLVERIKEKDNYALDELFDFYYPKILRYAIRTTMDVDQAKDITSNTFIRIIDNIGRFKWKDSSGFNVWIYRIATNEMNQSFRKHSHYRLLIDDEDAGFDPGDDNAAAKEIHRKIMNDDDLAMINGALSKMNKDYQEIIRLRYFEELPYEEIAQIMGKNESTVRVYSKRALEKLKEIINN